MQKSESDGKSFILVYFVDPSESVLSSSGRQILRGIIKVPEFNESLRFLQLFLVYEINHPSEITEGSTILSLTFEDPKEGQIEQLENVPRVGCENPSYHWSIEVT
jgi:hypothetical protein